VLHQGEAGAKPRSGRKKGRTPNKGGSIKKKGSLPAIGGAEKWERREGGKYCVQNLKGPWFGALRHE